MQVHLPWGVVTGRRWTFARTTDAVSRRCCGRYHRSRIVCIQSSSYSEMHLRVKAATKFVSSWWKGKRKDTRGRKIQLCWERRKKSLLWLKNGHFAPLFCCPRRSTRGNTKHRPLCFCRRLKKRLHEWQCWLLQKLPHRTNLIVLLYCCPIAEFIYLLLPTDHPV